MNTNKFNIGDADDHNIDPYRAQGPGKRPARLPPLRRHYHDKENWQPMILVWQKVKVILGLVLCVIGIAGTLIPVIPGVPIILGGVALMGADHSLVRGLKERLKRWRDGKKSSRT